MRASNQGYYANFQQDAQCVMLVGRRATMTLLDLPPEQAWMEEDHAQEQQGLGDHLIQTLDDDGFSDRKVFPKELEGITW